MVVAREGAMGRVIGWLLVALAAAALTWFLLAEDRPGARLLLDGTIDADVAEKAAGPGLKTREAQPLVVEPAFDGGSASIHGFVLDEDGKPLAGVRVAAQPRGGATTPMGERQRRAAMELFRPPDVAGKAVAWATSDADGAFEIQGLKENDRYRVSAEVDAPRYSSSLDWSAVVGKRWTLRLIVGTGSALRGRVVDADGKGIEAWVTAHRQGNIGNKTYIQGTWSPSPFATAKDGSFTMAAVPGGTLLFKVAVLGRGSRSNLPVDTPTDAVIELSFEDPSGATVEGRVTDTAGLGIAGAKVSVRSAPERAGGFIATTMRAVTTDATGAFSVVRLTPGVIQSVLVWAEGYVSPGSMGGGMPLSEATPTHLDIVLARGATITGRVLDPQGQPVAGAEVLAARVGMGYRGWSQELASATSDATGRFTLVDVPLGPGEIKGKADGYYQPPQEGQSSPYPWLPPPTGVAYDAKEEGQQLEKDVELALGRTIAGTVKDEDDQPAAGVSVTVNIATGGWYYGFQGQNKPVLTGEDGTFRYEGLAPDKSYNVTAQSETHMADAVKVTVPKDADPAPIEIKLQRGAIVQGRVTEADGKPAAGATVTCNYGGRSGVADAKGAFEITGIKAGKWVVQVGNVNPLPPSARQSVTLEWGQTLDGVELTMPVTLTIRGVVEDADGKALAGISVRAQMITGSGSGRRGRGRSYHATSDTKGAFELKALGEGDYTVWAGTAKQSPVRAGEEGLQLVYAEPERVTVEGRVTDPDGKAVARGSVRVWYGPRGKRNGQTGGTITGGYFRVRLTTEENEVDVEVTLATDATNRPVNFLPDRLKDLDLGAPLDIRLTRGLAVSGRITDDAGQAVAGIQVKATKKGQQDYGWYPYGGGRATVRSDDDGAWSIKGLKEGEYTVSVTPGGAWITPEKQTVQAGQADVVITLSKGLTIAGKVLDPDGEPLPAATVWAQETPASKASRGAGKSGQDWMASMRLRVQTGSDGSFELQGLPEGALFHVNAAGSGKEQAYISDTVKDVAAGAKDIVLQLGFGLVIEGEITGPDGEAVLNGYVQANPLDARAGLNSANTNLASGKNTFKLGPLKPGRYRITVQIQNNAYMNPDPQEADAGARGLRFVCSHAQSLRGRLVGDDVQAFNVYFVGQGGETTAAQTDANGAFTIQKVRSTIGTLFACKPGDYRYARKPDVEVGAGPYDLALKEGQTISGYVDNLPQSKQRPQVYANATGMWIVGTVDADGRFVITGLAPGTYMLQGWMSGGQIAPKQGVEAGASGVVLEFRPTSGR